MPLSSREEWLRNYIRGGKMVYIPGDEIIIPESDIEYIAREEGIYDKLSSKGLIKSYTLDEIGELALKDPDMYKILRHLWWRARVGGPTKLMQDAEQFGWKYPSPVCYLHREKVECTSEDVPEGLAWAIQRVYMGVSKRLGKPWATKK